MAEGEEDMDDRLSNLPDGVLSHILSFLPTRTCVTTSVLSRRWRHLWEYLNVLDLFDDSHVWSDLQPTMFKYFVVFVNGALTLRKCREIRKMRLECAYTLSDPLCCYSVDTWIHSVIGPHLEELHLTLFSTGEEEHTFLLPLTLFTCSNLNSLTLCGAVYLHLEKNTSMVRLPLLKTLKIEMGYVDADSLDVVLSGCFVLESLELCFSLEEMGKIRVPSCLKRLKVVVENDVGVCLEAIHGSDIMYLNLTQVTFSVVGDFQNVMEASLDVFPLQSDSVNVAPLHKLLYCLSPTTKRLLLGPSTTTWLLGAPVVDFPEFGHLLHLELVLSCFNWTFMVEVLKKCHLLQSLIIQNYKEQPEPPRPRPLPQWGLPELPTVPDCLVSHLTLVRFKGFEGFADDMEFAKYILRKGLVLKTMIIDDNSLELRRKFGILSSLSDVPRASCTCQLQLH